MNLTNKSSDTYVKTRRALQEAKQKLVELSKLDLSNIYVGNEWSWIPYAKEHIDFLIEQIGGVHDSLRDEPPPVLPEELDELRAKNNQ